MSKKLHFCLACKHFYIDLRNLMEQLLATVHVNMGEHLPHPKIRIYPRTNIPNAIRKFMQRYDLPEPVFAAMLDQIQQAFITHGLFSKILASPASEYTPSNRFSSPAFVTVDDKPVTAKQKNKRRGKVLNENPLDTPFYRLFVNDQSDCPNPCTERKQKKRVRNTSRLRSAKNSQSACSKDRNLSKYQGLLRKKNSQWSPVQKDTKVRQLFRLLTSQNQQGLLTFRTVCKLQARSPRLANTLNKLFIKGDMEELDEDRFVKQTYKLRLAKHFSQAMHPQLLGDKSPKTK